MKATQHENVPAARLRGSKKGAVKPPPRPEVVAESLRPHRREVLLGAGRFNPMVEAVCEPPLRRDEFPEAAYMAAFPDVAVAVARGETEGGYEHYLSHGRFEMASGERIDILSRLPAPDAPAPAGVASRFDETGEEFFEELYLEVFPDVAEAVRNGAVDSGRRHWEQTGHHEIRTGQRTPARYVNPDRKLEGLSQRAQHGGVEHFDGLIYFLLNPDVLEAVGDHPGGALGHWLDHGQAEGRIGPGVPLVPSRKFELSRLFERPFGINIFGPFDTTSGLGTAARAMAKAVKAAGIAFDLWTFSNDGHLVLPAAHQAGRKPRYRVNLLLANADLVLKVFTAYPEHHFDDAYNIAVWQWELASFRADWIFSTAGIDEIWTNSRFQRDAIASAITTPVVNVPLPVEAPQRPMESLRPFYNIPETAFVFLTAFDVGSTADRKNPFAVVEAFAKLKETHSDIHLVLKYHGAQTYSSAIAALRRRMRGVEDITIISDKLGIDAMDRLRASCDCLVSPHRSEGFGLNIAEFMSLGKPVVATLYSGNLDFFDANVGYPVDFDFVELEDTVGPYRKGFIWADPLAASIAAQMAKVLDDPAGRVEKGKAAARRIAGRLGLAAVGGAISARLDALEISADPPPFLRTLGGSGPAIERLTASGPADPMRRHFHNFRPLLSIIVPVYNVAAHYLAECVDSVRRQTYPFWELCLCDDGSTAPDTIAALQALRGSDVRIKVVATAKNSGIATATNRAIEVATGSFVVLLDNDDVLRDTALEQVVTALAHDQRHDVIYTDEDKIDPQTQPIDHFYKPDWSPEHLESVMYVLHMLVVRKSLLLKVGGLRNKFDGAQDYDLMLRLSRETDRIHHVAEPLYRWRAIPGSAADVVDAKPYALVNGLAALNEHMRAKYGSRAYAEEGLVAGTFRARRRPVDHMCVSLLILTGNKRMTHPERGEICLVENFVDSILAHTKGPRYEIIVVDNSTLAPAQVARFASLGVRVENHLPPPGPFNYAAKANFAVSCARNDNLVLLNDDMEIIREDWLSSLLELSSDPEIGAVGARLLHADGSIQHVGIVLGVNGGAAHLYHGFPRDFIGYNAFTHIIRNYSAVTAACLATRRSVVAEIGGFDESFATDYNDIDFCLKIRGAGYRIAYTPFAELYHYESISIQRSGQDPAEIDLFQRRWRDVLVDDPHYNRHLTRHAVDLAERVD